MVPIRRALAAAPIGTERSEPAAGPDPGIWPQVTGDRPPLLLTNWLSEMDPEGHAGPDGHALKVDEFEDLEIGIAGVVKYLKE